MGPNTTALGSAGHDTGVHDMSLCDAFKTTHRTKEPMAYVARMRRVSAFRARSYGADVSVIDVQLLFSE